MNDTRCRKCNKKVDTIVERLRGMCIDCILEPHRQDSVRDTAEAHWQYTEKVLRAAGLPDNTIAFGRVLYLESWKHADKHAREAARKK